MADVFTSELTFGQYQSGMMTPTAPGAPYRTIQIGSTPAIPITLGALAWYDPSDLTSMFQDSAGTTPAVVDSPVGKLNDKSGNGYHLIQATAGSRPILRSGSGLYWLAFDGADDNLALNVAALRLVGNLTLSAAAYKDGTGTFGGILTCQTGASTVNPYEWRFDSSGPIKNSFTSANALVESTIFTTNSFPTATAAVTSLRRTIGVSAENSINGVRESLAHTTVPTSDASSTFMMGDRFSTGIPLAGRIYGAAVFGSLLSTPNLALLETYLGTKCGIVI